MKKHTVRYVKKRGSLKKRNGGAVKSSGGKKSKVHRKKGSRRHIRIIKGGAAWIKNREDLSNVWNSLFYDRLKNSNNDTLVISESPSTTETAKKVLFVIDMQNDFLDVPYKRDGDEKHPVLQADPDLDANATIGNFPVPQGARMETELAAFIRKCIADAEYKYVIFSRDYHPVGHMSFNKLAFYEPNLCGECGENCDDGGAFPAHCVQGKQGSRFVPYVEQIINDNPANEKIKVVFKGIHKEHDSFTAFPKDIIDGFASNKNYKGCNGSCSSVSGGFVLKDKSAKDASDFMETIAIDSVEPANYEEWLKDVTVVEVCGLAGDYCVRDTVVALAEKYETDKTIVLLNDFTRYVLLPVFTIATSSQHLSTKEYANATSQNLGTVDNLFAEAKSNIPNKDISKYFIKCDSKTNAYTLMDKSDVEHLELKDLEFPSTSIQHFITPHEGIIQDYVVHPNIKMVMNAYEKKETKE